MEDAVSERSKVFATAHRSDEDRQAYISASRRASSVIAKAWQTTCFFLLPKSNPLTEYSLLFFALSLALLLGLRPLLIFQTVLLARNRFRSIPLI